MNEVGIEIIKGREVTKLFLIKINYWYSAR